MTRKLFVVVAVLAVVAVSLIGQSKDLGPFAGTWKLNIEKSKCSPGPGPKSQFLRYEPTTNGFVFTVDGVNAQGRPTRITTKAAFDGKDYPVEGSAQKTMRMYRRIDDHIFEELDKVDGKMTVTRRAVVSHDGKTLAVTWKGTNAQGQTVNHVAIYEKP